MNLFARLVGGFPADRGRAFLETADGAATSFADLLDQAGRIASLLRASGVEPGDRVVVQVEKSVALIGLYLGVLQAGAVYVPLNPAYTAAEVAHFIADAEPKVLVCDPSGQAALAPLVGGRGSVFTLGPEGEGTLLAQAARQPAETSVAERADADLAAILYTSGTTGRSKGAMLSHGNLWSNVATLHVAWGFRPDDVLLHALPLFHIHGLFVALNCMLLNGGRMIWLPKFDADAVISLLPRATVMMGVPTFYTRLLASPRFTREAARGMRLFVSGSAPLLASTFAEFEARTGHRILERYGMSETGINTSNPLEGDRVPGTVGPAAGRRTARPHARREGGRAGRDRRHRDPRSQRFQGLLADAGEDGRGVSPRRLVRHRRCRADRAGRLRDDRRPGQGPDHLGRATTSIPRRSSWCSTSCRAWSRAR